jgi:hypothetical protein
MDVRAVAQVYGGGDWGHVVRREFEFLRRASLRRLE